jgi:hypothetical protein
MFAAQSTVGLVQIGSKNAHRTLVEFGETNEKTPVFFYINEAARLA